jgi:hypothetical protein
MPSTHVAAVVSRVLTAGNAAHDRAAVADQIGVAAALPARDGSFVAQARRGGQRNEVERSLP